MVTRANEAIVLSVESLDELQGSTKGDVFTPGEDGFEQYRMAWNLTVNQHPALILVAKDASDIEKGVQFASQAGLTITVQSTGHGISRPADDCLLIVTSQMNSVRVDPANQSAWVEAGAVWGQVLEAAHPAGLAPLLGSSPGVGAIGYTLGGGLGWLARKYGLSCDSALSFELVTAEGSRVRASSSENSELFWALRGGGGSFGIVTGMEIQLYPVETIFGGSLIYPPDLASEVFQRYREWISTTPEELTTSIKFANFPDLPVVPEQFRGRSFVMVNGCYCGPVDQGASFVDPWPEWNAPIANSFRPMPFSEVASISNDPLDPMPSFSSGAWLRELTDEAMETIIRYGVSKNGSSPLVITEVRHVAGAMERVKGDSNDAGSNAFGLRDAPLVMHIISVAPTPELYSRVTQYTDQFKADLEPVLADGVYLNFLEKEESRQRTKDAFPAEKLRRLSELKNRYDPQNIFRSGFDIPITVE